MRAETNELQQLVIGLRVNQNQVRFDVATAVTLPVAGQRAVTVLFDQRLIIYLRGDDVDEISFQRLPAHPCKLNL